MKTRFVWIALLSLCLALPTVGSEPQWSVTLYDLGLNVLVELSPSGKTITELPNMGYEPRQFEMFSQWYAAYKPISVKITDDQRYLYVLIEQAEPYGSGESSDIRYTYESIIIDLVTMETIPVAIPPLEDDEVFCHYSFGAFNSDMTKVALPYASHSATIGLAGCNSGGMVTVELATGTITHRLDIDALFYSSSTAWLDAWTAEGIWFSPHCSTCVPPDDDTYYVWNPQSDSISETNVFHSSLNTERLTTTGELLYSVNHPEFPLGGSRAYYPPRNVVMLIQPDDYHLDMDDQIVYYDDKNLNFNAPPHWIMGGQAFLVTSRQHNVVVFRDGHQLTIDYASEEHFITMTSDGWLTIDRATNEIHHYAVANEIITGQTLYTASGEIVVANVQWIPPAAELPSFALDISPPDVVFCPGALPSRFQPGDWAEVIVNHEEAPIAALIVGDGEFVDVPYEDLEALPLGAHVQILGGPACSGDWWSYMKVAYQGKIGWMLENWETTFYLAPVSPTDEDLSGQAIGG